jgi:hypothetical protein
MAQATIVFIDANGTRWSIEGTILPDGNVAFNNVLTSAGNLAAIDASGNLATSGGSKTALNLTTTAVIKAAPGRLRKLIIVAPGSGSAAFTLSDCATVGAAAAGNLLFTLPYGATANVAGAIFALDMPCLAGLCLTAVPGSGSPICAVVYD